MSARLFRAERLRQAAGLGFNGVLVPMLIAAIGIIASIIGTFFVSTKEGATQKSLLGSLRRGTYIASILSAVGSAFLIFTLLPDNSNVIWAVISGLIAGVMIGYFTEYYTSDSYKPTKNLAKSSNTGSATIIIDGYRVGNVVNGDTCYYNRNFGNYKLLYRRRYGKL